MYKLILRNLNPGMLFSLNLIQMAEIFDRTGITLSLSFFVFSLDIVEHLDGTVCVFAIGNMEGD